MAFNLFCFYIFIVIGWSFMAWIALRNHGKKGEG